MGVLLGKVEAGVPLLKALDKVCRERTKDGKRSTFYTDRQILWRDPEVEKTPKDYTNPKHYQEHPSGVECIQITEHMNFCLGNAIKYVWRAGLKDSETVEKDLNKSLWYIAREMERLGLNCKWEPKK